MSSRDPQLEALEDTAREFVSKALHDGPSGSGTHIVGEGDGAPFEMRVGPAPARERSFSKITILIAAALGLCLGKIARDELPRLSSAAPEITTPTKPRLREINSPPQITESEAAPPTREELERLLMK